MEAETVLISQDMWFQTSKPANLRVLCILLSKLGIKAVSALFLKRIFSIDHYYILQKSITQPITIPKIRWHIDLRLANDNDIFQVINQLNTIDKDSKRELISRILFYRIGIKSCYVVTKDNSVAYLQWLIHPSENGIIKKNFKGIFYLLKEGQVLVENVFTFPAFRGYGLMPHITARLLEIAHNEGYKSAIMYIRKDRVESLSQNLILGFKITGLLREIKLFGITRRQTIKI